MPLVYSLSYLFSTAFTIVGHLDDLAGVFQCLIESRSTDLPVWRRCDLYDLVAAQGQGLGGRHAPGVRGDIVHHLAAADLADLIHRALQRSAGGRAGDLVVLSGVLVDLELACDGCVLPLNFHRFTGLDIDGLVLLVQLIAWGCFQLADEQLALALNGEVIYIDVALIVGGILSYGILVLIVDQEFHIVDPIAGDAVHLMNDDPAERLVFHGQGGILAILHGEIVARGIQLVPRLGFRLHSVVVPGVQREGYPAIAAGGDGFHQGVVHFPDLEGDAAQPLGLVRSVHLDELKGPDGIILKIQIVAAIGSVADTAAGSAARSGHSTAGTAGQGIGAVFDNDGLGRRIEDVPAGDFRFHDGHSASGNQAGDCDAPVLPGGELSNQAPVAVLDRKFCVRYGLPSDGIPLRQREAAQRLVVKSDRLRIGRIHLHGLDLGGGVNDISRTRGDLLRYDSPSNGETDLAHVVGGVPALAGEVAVGIIHKPALGVCQLELSPGQRSLGNLIQFPNNKGPGTLVDKAEGLPLAGLDPDALGCGVQDHTLGDLDLPRGDSDTRLQIRNDDPAILAGDVLTVAAADDRAAGIRNQESHTLQGLIAVLCLQILLNRQRCLGIILEREIVPAAPAIVASVGRTAGQSVSRAVLDDDGLRDLIQYVAAGDPCFRNHDCAAGDEAAHRHRAVLAGGILPDNIAVAVFQRELCVGNGLSSDGIQFPDSEAAQGLIIKIKALRIVRFDLHRLRPVGVADNVARDGILLCHYQRTYDAVNDDLPGFIGIIQAVGADFSVLIRQKFAAGGGDLERHALQRSLPIQRAVLVDNETARVGVLENQAVGRALLDRGGLGRHIADIAVGSLLLGCNDYLPRLEAGNGDEAVAVAGVPAVVCSNGRAVLIGHMKYRAGQRGLVRTLLQDGEGAVPLVPEGQALHLTALDKDVLGRAIQHESFHSLDLAHLHGGSRFDVAENDLARLVRKITPNSLLCSR